MEDFQMYWIKKGLEHDIDLYPYIKQDFSGPQLEVILEGLIAGVDVSSFAKPAIPAEEMETIKSNLLKACILKDIDSLIPDSIESVERMNVFEETKKGDRQ